MTKQKEIGIIGSGIAGLASACRLAALGHKITVFEANSYPGGKMTIIEGGGYRFDAGPSLFTLPELVDDVFHFCGRNPRDYYQYKAKSTACHYFWEDGTKLKAHTDPQDFAREIEHVLGVPRDQVEAYLNKSGYIYKHTTPVFLERSLHKLSTYLNGVTLNSMLRLHKLQLLGNLHDHNKKMLGHPKLVQLFDRFATYNGSSPYLTPGVMSSIAHLEHNLGSYYPEGGLHSIPQSLYRLAKELGVKFVFDSQVERIKVENKAVKGLVVNGQFHPFDLVVSNMDVVPTYRKLLPDQKAPERTLAQPRSSSALIFYWGVKKEFSDLDLHNIFFSENYREEFKQIFERQSLYEDPTVYVNISSKEDPTDAPPGCENWFVMVNVPGDTGQDWDQLIKLTRQRVIDKLNQILKVNLQDLIDFEDILEPRTIQSKTASYQGSLYGASSNNLMAAFLRHPNFTNRIKSLYFCGGSVHPGGGIPLCLLGAKITSTLIDENHGNV